MHIKRLEIQGFKSFKDRTVVHFNQSVTGIVGPNGCGKSNIVDAFFWVMGEQSYKHMRGNGSDDLIFNGSSRYSPLGLAEVTLVLESETVDSANAASGASARDMAFPTIKKEVSITRRVYRGGEGEYFINGVPARLKDIKELFLDTGAGTKGYSIVEQGQIAKVINAKPEERRALIEDVAGVAKYKLRKTESLRKMEAAEENLARLNDIVREIERNLGQLERQAQKAERHREYKKALFEKEMNWGRRKASLLNDRIERVRSEKDAGEHEITVLRTRIESAETALAAMSAEQLVLSKEAETVQERAARISGEITRDESALTLSKKRQEDLESQVTRTQGDLVALESEIRGEKERFEADTQLLKARETEWNVAREASHQADSRVAVARKALEDARGRFDALQERMVRETRESTDLHSRASGLQATEAALQSGMNDLETRLTVARTLLSDQQKEFDLHGETRARLSQELEMNSQALTTARSAHEQNETRAREYRLNRDSTRKELMRMESRLQSLRELDAAHEGITDGTKAILEWATQREKRDGILLVADVLSVSAEHQTTLEGWLDARLESLLVRDPVLAREAVDHLNSDRRGRAILQMIPSETRGNTTGDKADDVSLQNTHFAHSLEAAGFKHFGWLADHVLVGQGLMLSGADRVFLREVLSPALVVEDALVVACAIEEGRIIPPNHWALVDSKGTVVESNGIIRSGSYESTGTATTLLGRKRAITEIDIEVRTLRERLSVIEEDLARTEMLIQDGRERLESLKSEKHRIDVEVREVEVSFRQADRGLQSRQVEIQKIAQDLESKSQERNRALDQLAEVTVRLQDINQGRGKIETETKEASRDLEVATLGVRGEESILQDARLCETRLKEQLESLQRQLRIQESQMESMMRRQSQLHASLERVDEEKTSYREQDLQISQRIEALIQEGRRETDLHKEIRERLEVLRAQTSELQVSVRESRLALESRSSELSQLIVDGERMASELEHLKRNLEEKYGLGCFENYQNAPMQDEMGNPILSEAVTVEEEQLLEQELEELREKIRRLGEVNTLAIEEFQTLKVRYDRLTTERTDLEVAIKNLKEAIEHINETSKERFRIAFESVAERFSRLFPIIFGGGRAELTLVYPEGSTDILDAGVDIAAQPPGKKVQHISLLSGGEKALTAVSLIFSIFLIKPSPFCILDEVDAPLDDANIGKFNALLKEMSTRTQFIIITHNKKTMELNDSLYGVTMEEPGVSRMVSIELTA